MNRKNLRYGLLLLLIVFLFTGCAGQASVEEQLAGNWCVDGEDEILFALYDDGTCQIAGSYGTGTWSVVNDNQLKLTDFYGQTEIAAIKEIKDGKLTLGIGEDELVLVKGE